MVTSFTNAKTVSLLRNFKKLNNVAGNNNKKIKLIMMLST